MWRDTVTSDPNFTSFEGSSLAFLQEQANKLSKVIKTHIIFVSVCINYITVIGNTHNVPIPPIYFPRERQKINIHVTTVRELLCEREFARQIPQTASCESRIVWSCFSLNLSSQGQGHLHGLSLYPSPCLVTTTIADLYRILGVSEFILSAFHILTNLILRAILCKKYLYDPCFPGKQRYWQVNKYLFSAWCKLSHWLNFKKSVATGLSITFYSLHL